MDAAIWNLLHLDPAISDMRDMIIVLCRIFPFSGQNLTKNQKGFPPSLCSRGMEERVYPSSNLHRSWSGLQTPLLSNNTIVTMTMAPVDPFLESWAWGGGGCILAPHFTFTSHVMALSHAMGVHLCFPAAAPTNSPPICHRANTSRPFLGEALDF